jgi:molybdopterin synthase sulfur carrier subunit
MATVFLPTPLRRLTEGKSKLEVEASTVAELVDVLERDYPGMRERLCDETGEIKRFINLFVNGEEIRTLQGLNTPIEDGDEVSVIPAMAGGHVDSAVAVDQELDLKGEVCPFTFVKSKLAIEMMAPGQILRVTVDNNESANNVPRSLTNEGHNVLSVEKVNDTDWHITVQKKG